MSRTSLFRPWLAPVGHVDPGQQQPPGAHGWVTGWAGDSRHWASWQAGWALMAHLPVPSLCQAARPSIAPTSWPPPVSSPQAGEGSDV